jgi:hypothetical protein
MQKRLDNTLTLCYYLLVGWLIGDIEMTDEEDYKVRYAEFCLDMGDDMSSEGFREFIEMCKLSDAEKSILSGV